MGEEGQSVRGRGWVKFEEEGESGGTGQRGTTQRQAENEESPGSLEVSQDCSKMGRVIVTCYKRVL